MSQCDSSDDQSPIFGTFCTNINLSSDDEIDEVASKTPDHEQDGMDRREEIGIENLLCEAENVDPLDSKNSIPVIEVSPSRSALSPVIGNLPDPKHKPPTGADSDDDDEGWLSSCPGPSVSGRSLWLPPQGKPRSNRFSPRDKRIMIQYLIDNRKIPVADTISAWINLSSYETLDTPRTTKALRTHFCSHLINEVSQYTQNPRAIAEFCQLPNNVVESLLKCAEPLVAPHPTRDGNCSLFNRCYLLQFPLQSINFKLRPTRIQFHFAIPISINSFADTLKKFHQYENVILNCLSFMIDVTISIVNSEMTIVDSIKKIFLDLRKIFLNLQ